MPLDDSRNTHPVPYLTLKMHTIPTPRPQVGGLGAILDMT